MHFPRLRALALVTTVLAWGCTPGGGCRGDGCGTIVFAAIGQPVTLLPPVSDEIVDRDISDQIFLKLADIGPLGNTIGEAGFEPQLADRWRWADSLTLRFHIDARATWQDGPKVSAADVAFTFRAVTDSALDSPFRSSLARIASVTTDGDSVAVFHFRERYPEMFYDAVYQLRILPEHLLKSLPLAQWRTADFGRAPVGDGPYRFVRWIQGQRVELAADSTFFLGRPHIHRLIWRFNDDLAVAVTQVVAGEADAIEVLVTPANIERVRQTPRLARYPYAGSAYALLAFNLRARGRPSAPHPVLGDPDVRRALVLATDRVRMAQSVFGTAAKVPPAPIPQSWATLWFADLPVPPYDTVQAGRLLEARGWRDSDGDGIRDRGGHPLGFAIAVPGTSAVRKQYARLIQEQLRAVGVAVTIDEMDGPTMRERTHRGDFDAAIQTWSNDPAPSSGVPQAWSRNGETNFGHYDNPAFDRELARATHATTPEEARNAWRAAFGILAQDAPAIILCAPDNIAAIDARVADVRLRPDAYWAYVRNWRIPRDRMTDRDRLAP